MTSTDDIRDFVANGVLRDVMYANDALEISFFIGAHHKKINEKGHGLFFGLIQSFSDQVALMSIRKIFERMPNKYENRSLFSLFDFVSSYDKCEMLSRPTYGCSQLKVIPKDDSAIQMAIDRENVKALVAGVGKYAPRTRRCCPLLTDLALERVKTLANKEVAHNEVATIENRATYDDLYLLLEYLSDTFYLLIQPLCGLSYNGGRVQKPVNDLATILSRVLDIPTREVWREYSIHKKG